MLGVGHQGPTLNQRSVRPRRSLITLLFLGVALPIVWAFYIRPVPRPTSLSEGWRACLVEPASIIQTATHRPDVGPGAASVLYVRAKWGQSPFETEFQRGELLLELPQGLVAGSVVRFSKGVPSGSYREGGEGIVFDARTLEGTVRVIDNTPQGIDLLLDLEATSPLLNQTTSGTAPLNGRVRAPRATSVSGCVQGERLVRRHGCMSGQL